MFGFVAFDSFICLVFLKKKKKEKFQETFSAAKQRIKFRLIHTSHVVEVGSLQDLPGKFQSEILL